MLFRSGKVSDMLYDLARDPHHCIRVSNRCSINGFFIRIRDIEKHLTTQNSGVVVQGDGMEWYGVIMKIIVLDFANEKEVMLFHCNWFDVPPAPSKSKSKSRGYSRDEYGIIDIDTTKLRYEDEPYIMVNQTEQVCYVKSARKSNWSSVLRMKPRNLFAMPEMENTPNTVDDTGEIIGVEHMNISNQIHDLTNWSRNDVKDAKVIEEARQTLTSELSFADIVEDDDKDDDTYIADGVVAPAVDSSHGGGEDDFFV